MRKMESTLLHLGHKPSIPFLYCRDFHKFRRKGRRMRIGRREKLLAVIMVMVLGFAVYFRLWTIDYRISADETELIRKQFDLANREAMDESAEWRFKYDEEVEKANKCVKELAEFKESLKEKGHASMTKKLEMLQKENIGLLERVEALNQEFEAEKLKCRIDAGRKG